MPRNGSGTYSPPAGQPVVSGTTVLASTFNTLVNDLSTEMTRSLSTDGQTPMGANLPMGGNKITNIAAGTNASDVARFDQVTVKVNTSDLAAPSGHALVGTVRSATGARSMTQADWNNLSTVNVQQFSNVDATGTTGSSVGFAAAIAALRTLGGGTLLLGRGIFLLEGIAGADGILNGLLVPYSSANGLDPRIRIVGEGKATILRAGSNNMIVARFSDSHGGIEGVSFDANGKTGVKHLAVVPENTTQTTSTVFQIYNSFRNLYLSGGAEGIWLKVGPRVSGSDSGCWYNRFENIDIYAATRGIWMDNPPNLGPQNTRNKFSRMRIGQAGMNTGVQIDCGGTNTFFGVDFEGISSGTTPNTIPTAVKILAAGAVSGLNNDDNQFYGCMIEACTRDLDNADVRTSIFGGFWNAGNFGGGGVAPKIMFGADPTLMPVVFPGMQYGEGIAGYSSGYFGLTKDIADNSYPWQDWALSTSNVTNTASLLTPASKFSKLSSVVEWHMSFQFNASVPSTEILITPPLAPNAALYLNRYSRNHFCTFAVQNGSGVSIVTGGWTNTGQLYISAPTGGWNTGGNNNAILATVRFHT